jgi:hypothetical protein
MGPSPLDELAEKFRGLQQGAGENLGRLRRAAEAFAAGFDQKKRENKSRVAAAEGHQEHTQRITKPSSNKRLVPGRRGQTQASKMTQPVIAVSHTNNRRASEVIVTEHLMHKTTPGERLEAGGAIAAMVVVKKEEFAEVCTSSCSAGVLVPLLLSELP